MVDIRTRNPRALSAFLRLMARPFTRGVGNRVHGNVKVGANWHGTLHRCRKSWDARERTPPGFTRTAAGLLVPLWERVAISNLIVNEGLDHFLDVVLSAATQDTTWFVGLTQGTPTFAAGDDLSTHGGWVEDTNYDEANRQAFTDGGVSSQSLDNSGSPAVFTCSADSTTWGGGFLAGVNSGTAGLLLGGSAFDGGDKAVDDGDTLDVTITYTASDS